MTNFRPSITAIVIGVAVLISGIVALFGGTPWIIIGVDVVAWILCLAPRFGYLTATAISTLLTFGVLLGALLLSAALPFGILATIGVVLLIVGAAATALLFRAPSASLRRPGLAWRDAAASCVGLAVWIIALIASARVPLLERLGWAMRNDSMNNLVLAHGILRAHGVVLGGDGNPTPLPAGLIALGLVAGRPSTSPELSLHHDLIGMSLTWAALIGLLSVLMGLTAVVIVRSVVGSGIASSLAGLAGSLLVLSWYETGYPIEYGFVNLDVVLPVLLASVILTFTAERTPWLVVSGLMLASTLVLSAWSPLVLIPLGLLALTVIRSRHALAGSGRAGVAIMVVAAVQLIAYAVFGVLPSILVQGSALADNGGIYDQNHAIVFVTGAAVLVTGYFVFRRDRARFVALATVVLGSWLALGILLFLNRKNRTVWSYYPLKLSFFATVLFIVLALGLVIAFLAQRKRNRVLLRVGAVVVAGLVLAIVVVVPRVDVGLTRLSPVARLLVSHPQEEFAQQGNLVQELAATGKPTILWDTKFRLEGVVDVWLLQLRDDTLSSTSKLRIAAYEQLFDHSTKSLCTTVRLLGPSTVIYTPNEQLPGQLAKACPAVSAHFAPPPPGTP